MDIITAIRLISYLVIFIMGAYSFMLLSSVWMWPGSSYPLSRALSILVAAQGTYAVFVFFVALDRDGYIRVPWVRDTTTAAAVGLAVASSMVTWILRKRRGLIQRSYRSSWVKEVKEPAFSVIESRCFRLALPTILLFWLLYLLMTTIVGDQPLAVLLVITLTYFVCHMTHKIGRTGGP